MILNRMYLTLAAALIFGLLSMPLPSLTSAADYYAGKTVTLIATTAPGGTGDLRIRAVAPFLQKYLPGNPTVVIEYISGGGGRKGANHLYNNVRPDGFTIGAASGGIVGLAITGEIGVKYDPDKFIYLGAPEHINHAVIYTRAELGLNTLDKLRAKSGLRIGGQQVGHTSYTAGRLLAYFLDMKEPKFIVGYSSPEVDLALIARELDGRANNPTSALRRNPDWLNKGIMDFHAMIETPLGHKYPRLEHLPEIGTFARTEQEKRVIGLWRNMRGVGSPYIVPPGTPKEVVGMIRTALDKTFNDPEFAQYFKKLTTDDISPLGWKDLTQVVADIPRDKETLDFLKKFSGAGPLPPRH